MTVVTGGHGFLGRHVLAALAEEGVDAVAAGRPELEIPSPAFEALLRARRPEVVVHCAGPASVAASVDDPAADRAGSVDTTARLLDALAQLPDPPKLVLVSSAAVYGDPASLPVAESDATAPISPYGRHRLEVEELVRSSGVPFVVGRVFSAYGEGLRRQVLWDIVTQALAGTVELWGTGDESRDFVHAHDVARALARLGAGDGFAGDVVNVAGGRETTIAELAHLLVAALEVDVPISFGGVERPGDPLRWLADVGRIRSLGWRPEVELEDGLRRYARWAREQLR